MIGQELRESDYLVDVALLSRLDEKVIGIETTQKFFESEYQRFIEELKNGKLENKTDELARLETRRGEFNEILDSTRRLMLTATQTASAEVIKLQNRLHRISLILVALATILAISLAAFITKNISKPVRVLLNGTNSVIDGRLEVTLPVTSSDEIGNLTHAFNSMTGELRKADIVRDMFGKYIDPRIVKGLIDQPDLKATKGQRQVMTILFLRYEGFYRPERRINPRHPCYAFKPVFYADVGSRS